MIRLIKYTKKYLAILSIKMSPLPHRHCMILKSPSYSNGKKTGRPLKNTPSPVKAGIMSFHSPNRYTVIFQLMSLLLKPVLMAHQVIKKAKKMLSPGFAPLQLLPVSIPSNTAYYVPMVTAYLHLIIKKDI